MLGIERENRFLRAALVVLSALIGVVTAGSAEAGPVRLVQPFRVAYSRFETQVIAFLGQSPDYDAVEVFYQPRPGQAPLLKAIVTALDGAQVDHINDPAVAEAIWSPFRPTVVRDIDFEQTVLPGGAIHTVTRLVSYRGEHIEMDVTTIAAPSPALGGFIDPGNHAETSALPVLWVLASAPADTGSSVLIDGVPQPIAPGPVPGTLSAFHSAGFDLGVIGADVDPFSLLQGPEEIAIGATWTFCDTGGGVHSYQVIDLVGSDIVIRRITGLEEIIVARKHPFRPRLLEIRSVRATGIPAALNITPPPPFGLTLDLTVPGQFSVSLHQHANLITGTAEVSYGPHRVSWALHPDQPSWAVPRSVYANGWFNLQGDTLLVTTIGSPFLFGD
ncbi:MAG: hypothetical protein R3B70_47785 [Polyangiaceae bacterium]